ncbi:galactokinase [Caenimonas aquaedulcis]|uniref:Galactokinase n=1 Tax=Caenimonas aquaedulcis TaxID=2793270 RepID=A0A931H338_9BURK|nr:galactokinase [Caenimonas aquaedulcis]MBG9387623.1 galactokinase [Caenimonas aquaedulcis]
MSAHPMEAAAQAPGRVNLLGEHTDYNDGFVLPIAISQATHVRMRRNGTSRFHLHSAELGARAAFTLGEAPAEHFASYVYGCVMLAAAPGGEVPGLDIEVSSQVPMGVGLSSSAALEVATLRCLRELLGLSLDDVEIAQLAQRVEIEFAHVRCGIMDQMASSLAATDRAVLIDTRSLERRDVPLPAGASVLVLDSGVARKLAASGYNQRRAECEAAAAQLGVASLRDVRSVSDAAALPDPLCRRVHHVVTENARVMQAARTRDPVLFGELMNASHASQRDDYEVSTPEVDMLVRLLQDEPGVYGARLTGGGFGGACVALCRSDRMADISASVLAHYAAAGLSGRQLVPAQAASSTSAR